MGSKSSKREAARRAEREALGTMPGPVAAFSCRAPGKWLLSTLSSHTAMPEADTCGDTYVSMAERVG